MKAIYLLVFQIVNIYECIRMRGGKKEEGIDVLVDWHQWDGAAWFVID